MRRSPEKYGLGVPGTEHSTSKSIRRGWTGNPPRQPAPANFRESPQTQSPQPLPAHAAPEPESPTSEAGSRKPEAGFPLLYNQPEPTSRPTPSVHTPPAPPRSARNVSAARSATISSPEGASPRKAPVVRPGKPQPRASETVEHGPIWPCDFSSVVQAPPSPGQIRRWRTASSAALSQPTSPDNGPSPLSLRSPREPTLCYRIYRQVQHEAVTSKSEHTWPANPVCHRHPKISENPHKPNIGNHFPPIRSPQPATRSLFPPLPPLQSTRTHSQALVIHLARRAHPCRKRPVHSALAQANQRRAAPPS
jgi:hypothetical protein